MKSLQNFINETLNLFENSETTKITFDFTDIENAKEIIDSLNEKEGVTVDDFKVTINVNKDNATKLESVQDILQQYVQNLKKSKNFNTYESYANKVNKIEITIGKLNDCLDEILNSNITDDKEDE